PNRPGSNTLRLITVGRLSPTKRPQMLIDTLQLLKNQGRDVSLTIAGAGAMLKSLHQRVSKMNLTDHVNLKGRVEPDSMPALYQHHDLFISATSQEGMSNAMLEAMASGLPIITTPCEGAEELIADNGIVVEDPTASAIAQAITTFTGDPAKIKTMAEAARNQAQQFSWKTIADKYLEYYKKIIHPTDQI
ncbi:MAG: glycosyltransferase family 4 protein, partial [Planctomycetes bacterium]|nr:glycosyltransferase family 4 protein [Planctomycetota bacterium]